MANNQEVKLPASEFTEQTVANITEAGTSDFVAGYTLSGGKANRRFSLSSIANYVLNKFKLSLGGSNQTVKSAVDTLNSNDILPNNRTAIPNNSDLNDYKTAGVFAVSSDSSAATITNMPRSASGKLIVLVRGNNAAFVQQKYITTSATYIEYVRNYNNGTWTAWEQLPTRAEVDALSSKTTSSQFVITYSSVSANHAVYKQGGICKLHIAVGNDTLFSDATGYDNVGSIPDGYRPNNTVVTELIVGRTNGVWANATNYIVTVRIETNGDIYFIGNMNEMKVCKYLSGDVIWTSN